MTLKDKLSVQFKDEWLRLLNNHLESEYMEEIFNKVKIIAKDNKVLPSQSDVFNAFKGCDVNNVIVCFVLGEPIVDYNISKSFQNMSRWIEQECFDGLNLNLESNLDYMLPQGVFNLPIIMTKSPKAEHNQVGWQKFTREVLRLLNQSLNKIIFVYEDCVMEYMDGINTKWHKIVKLEQGCFKEINNFVLKEYNVKLDWNGNSN